jgi:hypothetical protein
MPRTAAAIVLGAGVVLVTWVSAPAAPTPLPAPIPAEVIAAIDALAPLAADVGQETEKLRARMAQVVEPPSPRRDPFAFGERRPAPPRPSPATPAVVDVAQPEITPEAPIAWPTLAGVFVDAGTSTAVLGIDDTVEFVTVDQRLGNFVVVSIGAASIELRHSVLNITKTLSLR